jgi:DNA ligase-associated metallophosphoesterase
LAAGSMLTMETDIVAERMVLHPLRALYWPRMGWLLVSDLHLGKAAHLRKGGLALPEGGDAHTLARLDAVLGHFRPQRLVIIGDLFHSAHNSAWSAFEAWCRSASVALHLVAGNHDVLADRRYHDAGITVHPGRLAAGDLVLQHAPPHEAAATAEGHIICGHVHPGVVLHGKGGQRLRLPCFLAGTGVTMLPAFGTSTGLHVLRPAATDRVFACTDRSVLDVTGVATRAAHRA